MSQESAGPYFGLNLSSDDNTMVDGGAFARSASRSDGGGDQILCPDPAEAGNSLDKLIENASFNSLPHAGVDYAEPYMGVAPLRERERAKSAAESSPVSPCPFWKRAMDVTGAGLAIVLLSLLLLALALWIKVVSRGPVFFRQRRYGLAGQPFQIWKFRTLRTNEVEGTQRSYMVDLMENERPMVKRDRELPIIFGGRLIRKFGLDELPQLFNVLKGDMSIVGPRPHVVPLQSYAVWQRRRFDVLPGITGLWQVSDKERTTFSEMMQMDIEYIRRRSLWFDVSIMLRTIPAIALD